MLRGLGRHRLSGGRFQVRGDLGQPGGRRNTGYVATAAGPSSGLGLPIPDSLGNGLPSNTTVRSFAKPTNLALSAGLLARTQTEIISMARDMFDDDPIAGAVAETLVGIPFGSFSLTGMPDKSYLKPYTQGMDRMRVRTLMPALALSYLVDGAFLGTASFDDASKCFDAIMPHDLMHAEITPVPFFGATPIIDLQVSPEIARIIGAAARDERVKSYFKFIPDEFKKGGLVKLQPESTVYIPRRTLAHNPLGTSMFRKIMVVFLLEKALARGTIEMAYRRQRPILHLMAGDENWDPSIAELQELTDLFLAADLDPLGAVVATRMGVQPQEISGAGGDFWRWTDNIDVLTSLKLKGLAMPDGLLGGDMSLDSVSATLTVFINMMRAFRDYITRAFFYEKIFPYTAIVNNHRRELLGEFSETSAQRGAQFTYTNEYVAYANDSEVDLGDYLTPMISWHSSVRPEGDREYLDLLMVLQQAGVPIPLRMMAAAGGQDIHDIINGAQDDLELREQVSKYNEALQKFAPPPMQGMEGMDQGMGGGDMGGGAGGGGGGEYGKIRLPIKPRGMKRREFDDYLHPRTNINGTTYVTTARERNRMNEKANRIIAKGMADVAKRCNRNNTHIVDPRKSVRLPSVFGTC